ncbi:MAG TPA: gliding motility lipoprotein GldH [Microscillaceae bacterium]|nr:gliding motility lipoprotein GldH [Microscillaceae bacterium]
MLGILAACNSSVVVEKHVTLTQGQWNLQQVPAFEFTIQDTNATYQVDYIIENTLDYPFYNLYVRYECFDPSGKIVASQLQHVLLFEEKSGKPIGKPDWKAKNFTADLVAIPALKFKTPGKHTFKLTQYMRQNPLKAVNKVGIRIQKTRL